MSIDSPRFEAVFNLGQLMTMATFALSISGLIWWQSDFQANTRARIEAGEAVRAQYVPIVNGLAKAQEVTNSQLVHVSQTNRDLLKEITDLWREVVVIRERLAALEANGKRPQLPR